MKKILVVDDEPVSVSIAMRILEKHYDVKSAMTGLDGLRAAAEIIPDLVLLDINMPDMDGFTILAKMKSEPLLQHVPVVFLTGQEDSEAEIRGFEGGADDFITKPFIPKIMLRRVQHVLEMYELKYHLEREVKKQMAAVMERQQELENITEQTMLTLAGTIDAKDRYTSGHSARVANYSRIIARRAGFSLQDEKRIYYMGLLHDIGKIGVPDDILNKPGKLTDEEYEAIKSHTVIGARILAGMTAIPGLDSGARWHHERYDGRGYPDGLKGEDIPDFARVIGVADSYDAMSSSRSYRKYLPQDVIRREIEKNRGTQFDPLYADIMLKMIDEDKNYRMHDSSSDNNDTKEHL